MNDKIMLGYKINIFIFLIFFFSQCISLKPKMGTRISNTKPSVNRNTEEHFASNPNDFIESQELTEIKGNENYVILKRNKTIYRIDIFPLKGDDLDYIKHYTKMGFIKINLEGYFNKLPESSEGKVISYEENISGLENLMIIYLPNGSIGTGPNDFKLNAYRGLTAITTDSRLYIYTAELIPADQFTPEKEFSIYKAEIINRLRYVINEYKLP